MEAKEFFKNDLFATGAGIELLEVRRGKAVARLATQTCHQNAGGSVQGGAIFTLADLALAAASNSHGRLAVSLSSNITFVHAATPGDVLTATATERHLGRTTSFYNIIVTNQDGRLVAEMTSSCFRKDVETGLTVQE